jgi:hypothetical protein
MAQQEILGDQRLAVAHGRTDEAEEEQEILEHGPKMMRLGARSRPADFCTLTHRTILDAAGGVQVQPLLDEQYQGPNPLAILSLGRRAESPSVLTLS